MIILKFNMNKQVNQISINHFQASTNFKENGASQEIRRKKVRNIFGNFGKKMQNE